MASRSIGTRCWARVAVLVFAMRSEAARAESVSADSLRANDLFFQGKALMEGGNVAAGCQKLAQSLAIQRRGGTILNLAVCRATLGQHATALRLFEEALELAKKDGRADRQELARAQIDEARSKLSWLTILASRASVPGVKIECDGEEVPADKWGAPQAIDSGRHVIVATAPGAKRFETTVFVGGPGDDPLVAIPPFASDPSARTVEPRTKLAGGLEAALSSTEPGGPSNRRRLGWTSTGFGAAALVVGATFGIKAFTDVAATKQLCPNDQCPTDEGIQKHRDAARDVVIADIAVPVGAAAACLGIYLLLSSGPPRPTATAVGRRVRMRFVPGAGPDMGTLSIQGVW